MPGKVVKTSWIANRAGSANHIFNFLGTLLKRENEQVEFRVEGRKARAI